MYVFELQTRYLQEPPQQSPRDPQVSPQAAQLNNEPNGVHVPEQQFEPEGQLEPQELQLYVRKRSE